MSSSSIIDLTQENDNAATFYTLAKFETEMSAVLPGEEADGTNSLKVVSKLPCITIAEEAVDQDLERIIYKKNWFNDTNLTEFFNYLSCRYEVAHIDPILINNGSFDKLIEKINTWQASSKKKKRLVEQQAEWVKAEVILCPVLQNSHWHLIIIKKAETHVQISCLDSLSQGEKNKFGIYEKHQPFIEGAAKFLDALGYQGVTYLFNSCAIPYQNNSGDCGAAICYMAEQYCRGIDLADYEDYAHFACDYSGFRANILKGVLAQRDFPPLSPSTATLPALTYAYDNQLRSMSDSSVVASLELDKVSTPDSASTFIARRSHPKARRGNIHSSLLYRKLLTVS